MSRALLLTVALSVVSCCSSTAPLRMAADGEQKQQKQHQPLAFANSFLPSAAAGVAACSFAGDRSSVVPGASIDELASSMSGGWSMSCRRNLKKEKRARNEHMAPPVPLRQAVLFSALVCASMGGAVASVVGAMAGERKGGLAFAASIAPTLRPQFGPSAFLGDRSEIVGSSRVEMTEEVVEGISMSCRRNLKKEKRARNEHMARQFRKPTLRGRGGRGGRGRGGGRAEAERKTEADSEWLSQIYGQHTIYRRDNTGMGAATKEEASSEEKEKVAA
eukprot:CAMPEP_0206228076 /NCGR_PEP_ID=MMETSP0047_2-20121206/8973_1 /ASSEMBLY_ACC=CAM_ASM_000192 /TAXON_ID=195065 /ORGANISM="Chroomonas mesostigmatica_cf, Strain CCMP1168" /LENGTH=275 /DNA_ID=CAMNT_0053651289 /DNA_START=9 /DNA_END=835 /DNA_ORIENTATION=+